MYTHTHCGYEHLLILKQNTVEIWALWEHVHINPPATWYLRKKTLWHEWSCKDRGIIFDKEHLWEWVKENVIFVEHVHSSHAQRRGCVYNVNCHIQGKCSKGSEQDSKLTTSNVCPWALHQEAWYGEDKLLSIFMVCFHVSALFCLFSRMKHYILCRIIPKQKLRNTYQPKG